MNNRELARTTCFDNMSAFGKAKATALAAAAADSDGRKKAKAKARAKFGELETLNVAIGKEVAKQQSGGKAVCTTSRGVLRDALTGDLRECNRTAAAVAEDLKRPQIMDGFGCRTATTTPNSPDALARSPKPSATSSCTTPLSNTVWRTISRTASTSASATSRTRRTPKAPPVRKPPEPPDV